MENTTWLQTLWSVAEFLVVGVFFKYIVVHWIAEKMMKFLKYILVNTERQAVAWIHYREKARGKTHQYDTPETCKDGVCRVFHKAMKQADEGKS